MAVPAHSSMYEVTSYNSVTVARKTPSPLKFNKVREYISRVEDRGEVIV